MRASKISQLLHQLRRFARLVRQRLAQDRCNSVAQSLAFITLLSLVPLTIVIFALFSVYPTFEKWTAVVQTFIYSHFVPASGAVVQNYLQQLVQKSARLTAAGLVFLLVTALLLMHTIEQTFNNIWRVTKGRKPLHRFLTYWAILGLGPILAGISLSISSYVFSLPLFSGSEILHGFRAFAFKGLPFLFEVLAFLLLYTVVPNATVKWRHALLGSLFAAVLFEIAKRAFAVFVLHYSSYQLIYGAIATLPVFMIWVYVSWFITLLGAVLVASLPEWNSTALKEAP